MEDTNQYKHAEKFTGTDVEVNEKKLNGFYKTSVARRWSVKELFKKL